MSGRDWNERYASGDIPWDGARPDPHLVEFLGSPSRGFTRVLDVGCGTGTNALWIASWGYEVTGIDLAPLAISKAQEKARSRDAAVTFSVLDFLHEEVPGGPFDLVFDRGVFHVFDEAADRARFAARVAEALSPGGMWLSLAGSTEGPARDHGPPRRSARDILVAVEPSLELLELRGTEFVADLPSPAKGWRMLARRRLVEAQPSTRR